MSTPQLPFSFTILGQPYSKANSRQFFKPKGKKRMISAKSNEALAYVRSFHLQCPQFDPPLTEDLCAHIVIYYSSRKPDLDESLILDCMQSVVRKDKRTKTSVVTRPNIYKNDRQVKERHIYWGLDRENPRAEITIEPWSGGPPGGVSS